MDKSEEILKEIQDIKIKQAVTHEKLSAASIVRTEQNREIKDLDKRMDKFDKIVGAVSLAVVILGVLVKFKII